MQQEFLDLLRRVNSISYLNRFFFFFLLRRLWQNDFGCCLGLWAGFGGLESKFVLLFQVFDHTTLVEVSASQLLDNFHLLSMLFYPGLEIIVGILNPSLVLAAPTSERRHHEFPDIRRDLLVTLGCFDHLSADTLIRLELHPALAQVDQIEID